MMMQLYKDWAVIIPMANEENEFVEFVSLLTRVLDEMKTGSVYLIVDNVSTDNTLQLCSSLSKSDPRYHTVFAPDNKCVVDAYLKGYQTAYDNGHQLILEMDAGLSHDPRAIPIFIRALNEGNECTFGSRFINGGSMGDSPMNRWLLSRVGTMLANMLLGTNLHDMTSGYQGFHREIVGKILNYKLKSRAHFYQTEIRYILRKFRCCEIPIHYNSPSPRVSQKAIRNAIDTLFFYFMMRLRRKSMSLK